MLTAHGAAALCLNLDPGMAFTHVSAVFVF